MNNAYIISFHTCFLLIPGIYYLHIDNVISSRETKIIELEHFNNI